MIELLIAALIVNGEMDESSPIKERICSADFIVAVDGGLNLCHQMNITPHRIIGDFDSVSPAILNEYKDVETIMLERAKDKTDLEEAIDSIDIAKFDKLFLYGALGGRQDQVLGHYYMLLRYPGKLFIETEEELIVIITKECGRLTFASEPGQTISLIPFYGEARGVMTDGLKWELPGTTLSKDFLGISNICLKNEFSVSVDQGALLCMINKNLIDKEMITLTDHTSTAIFTQ